MDDNSNEGNSWGIVICQAFLDLGGEVQVGDKDFLKRVEKIADDKEKRIPFNFEASVRKTIYWYAKGHSQKYKSDKKYFLKVDRGVYRLLDASSSTSKEKIEEENKEYQIIFKR